MQSKMIPTKLKREIEKMVHKRSPGFLMKLMAVLEAEKAKKKKYDSTNKHPGVSGTA
jgi:hypothetical protein